MGHGTHDLRADRRSARGCGPQLGLGNRVLAHAEVHENDYWIRVDELSYMSDLDDPGPVSVVRRFDVADAELFEKVQGQIMETSRPQMRPIRG